MLAEHPTVVVLTPGSATAAACRNECADRHAFIPQTAVVLCLLRERAPRLALLHALSDESPTGIGLLPPFAGVNAASHVLHSSRGGR